MPRDSVVKGQLKGRDGAVICCDRLSVVYNWLDMGTDVRRVEPAGVLPTTTTPACASSCRHVGATCCEVIAQFVILFALLFLLVSNWYLKKDLAQAVHEMDKIKFGMEECLKFRDALQQGNPGNPVQVSSSLFAGRRKRSTHEAGPTLLIENDITRQRNTTGSVVGEDTKEWVSEEAEVEATTKILPPPHKRHRKYKHRASSERFFTGTGLTTSTPIMVRQSRTKPTHSSRRHWISQHNLQGRGLARKPTHVRELKPSAENLEFGGNDYEVESVSAEAEDVPSCTACPVLSAHYIADTSNYTMNKHQHYQGNGRIRVSGVYKDWKPAHWTQQMGMSKHFHLHQGNVTVMEEGVYLLYAQIHYANVQEVNGYKVMRNNGVISQCTATTTHPDRKEVKADTCSVSTTVLLHAGDKVYLRDLHHERFVILTPEKSYFGLILVSPIRNNLFGR